MTARPLTVCFDCALLTPLAEKRRHPLNPGEGPLKLAYSSAHCLDFKRHKSCRRGNACPYSHGYVYAHCAGSRACHKHVSGFLSSARSANVTVRLTCGARSAWEVGLHPSSYRSQMCTYGSSCNRRMCFFAHDPSQLRVEAAMKYIDMEQAQFGISEVWRPEGRACLSCFSRFAGASCLPFLQTALSTQRHDCMPMISDEGSAARSPSSANGCADQQVANAAG